MEVTASFLAISRISSDVAATKQTFAQEQELLVQGLHGELDSLRQRVKLAEGASP